MTISHPAATLRILSPVPGVFAYYDGRILGRRLHSQAENWLDDGAYKLGIASYAIVDGTDALVYDTHMTIDHAQAVRTHLRSVGADAIRVVLSHWHDDHVAGNSVFADCEIISHRLTLAALSEHRIALESGNPPIRPLVLPSHIYEDRIDLKVGARMVSARHFDIHSADGTVLLLEDASLLFAGDTVEDTVTYISEPEHTGRHIAELGRLATLPFTRVLPCHGDPDIIASGGYTASLLAANRSYLTRLMEGEGRDGRSLAEFVAEDVRAGFITYFAPYEDVHRANVKAMAQR